jgi:hypothetical protein
LCLIFGEVRIMNSDNVGDFGENSVGHRFASSVDLLILRHRRGPLWIPLCILTNRHSALVALAILRSTSRPLRPDPVAA